MLPWMVDRSLERVRKMIASLPETSEKLSHGAPTWWGGAKTFAMFHAGAYDEGRVAVWVKAEDGMQASLIEANPARFYRPKYLGPSGWVGIRLDRGVDWGEVEVLLVAGYRLVAPKRALAALDGGAAPASPRKAAPRRKAVAAGKPASPRRR
jgi:hypothetical protein